MTDFKSELCANSGMPFFWDLVPLCGVFLPLCKVYFFVLNARYLNICCVIFVSL